MYNDEQNLYHYTYRRDGSEAGPNTAPQPAPAPEHQNGPQQPVQEMKPVKKSRAGVRTAALMLCAALLGGAVGGGVVYGLNGSGSGTGIQVSSRPVAEVTLQSVDGKTLMTDAEVYAANVNSVVSINVTGSSGTNFFGQTVETASSGSGFILTTDGYIVTNYHVVKDANTVKVTLYNGDTYDARYIGGDEDYDIAVIKIDASDLQAVTLGDSDKLNVGDHVLAIGNPLGELTFSMSEGIASSVNRAINVDGTPFNMIQVTASINPGNSGGPLLNSYGEVVGIVSAKYSSYSSESVEGLGFAIPINDVVAMIEDIMTNGYVTNKPYLAVVVGTLERGMVPSSAVSAGAYIYSVEEGGAADRAGLQAGDIITRIDDTAIEEFSDITAALKSYTAGDTATITYYRGNEEHTAQVTFDSVPQDNLTPTTDDGSSQDGGDYSNPYADPWEFFEYFFGNGGRYSDRAA